MKTILAHLPEPQSAPQVLGAALHLAGKLNAHLAALHVMPQPYVPVAPYGDVAGEIIERERQALVAQADRIEAMFRSAVAGRPDRTELRRVEAHWAPVSEIVTLHARSADLAVLAQPAPGIRLDYNPADVAEDVMMGSGRPVLLVPRQGVERAIGGRVLVAWNGSREGSRAVFDSLPFLVRAREVRVLTIEPVRPGSKESAETSRDIAAALARHGVPAITAATMVRGRASVADELIARVAELGADLLVMGGYGHTRLREAIFGGATIGVLAAMSIPVLMSH